MASTKNPERLADDQVLALAARYERAARLEGRVQRIKQDCAARVIGQLDLRRVKSLAGEDTTVTKVQAVGYDGEALYAACDDEQRAELFTSVLDLQPLPAEVRATLIELLSERERAAITRHVLDTAALQAAVATRRIKAATVRRAEKPGAPYIKVSHGGPPAPAPKARR